MVLEGKYWKRDYNVISAEYKKWRRFYHRTIDPNNALEAVSCNNKINKIILFLLTWIVTDELDLVMIIMQLVL